MGKTKNTRRFNYDGPIAYQGSLYPSTQMDIEDDKGNVSSRNVFADAKGQYYTLNEDGNAIPVILQNNLDEVTVTAPRNRRNTFNDYLTMGNDVTKVFNMPHREYNPHLREAAIKGAESHALWEKEHPNATAWGNMLASVPFAVAATPFAMAAGDAMAGSAMGQYIGNGLNMVANAASNSSWLPWADTLASSYFATHGLQDMANGEFTPETALEVMPLSGVVSPMIKEGKHLARNINDYNNLNKFIERYGYTEYKPKLGLIFDDEKLDRLTNQLVRQHNRFTRGVSVKEAREHYDFPEDWTDEQIAEYTLTHPHIPSKQNSGGNPDQKSVLYTSNSLDLSRLYTDENGYVGILQRPIKFDTDRSKMLEINDFRFNRQSENPYSATTDEPYVYNKHIGKPAHTKIKGALVHKNKGRIAYTYNPVSPTFLDAQANAGAEIVPIRRPDDLDFRHYLFYGEPEEQLLGLEKLIKYTKPKGAASVDYAPHSVGFSKKKALGGEL